MTQHGRNVWYDLMTTNMHDAQAFYSDVLGWKVEGWKDADPNMPYLMWTVEGQPIGGLMALPEEAKQMGAPPHWLAYTAVDNVDASTQRVLKLGGRIYKEPSDIPKVGRFSVVADPQGATFSLFSPLTEMAPMDREQHGQVSWAELNTVDADSAWRFYTELFGWQETGLMPMGPGETYRMFKDHSGSTMGGMSNAARQMKAPPHWLYYVTVRDMDATVARIQQKGGKVVNGPMAVPGDDLIAQCQDPQGAFFAIYSKGKAAR